MNEESIITFSLCAFIVFLFGAVGFLISSILTAANVSINSSVVEIYYNWVETQMFSATYFPYYLLISVLFAVIGIFLIYSSKKSADESARFKKIFEMVK
jgi:cell division protein FtsX